MKHLDNLLEEVIREARAISIPVPNNIYKEVYINSRPKKRFGCCKRRNGHFQIEVSQFMINCRTPILKGVLAHEVLHTCEGCYEHGKLWKQYAQAMNQEYGYNIKRTSTFEEMGLPEEGASGNPKYIIRCKKCGAEYPRQRYTCVMKKINAYRCKCGGKLTLEKLDTAQKRG
jgi:predicted SprT family Zn-dependent metalloprotease